MFTSLTVLLDWGKRKAVDWFECREKESVSVSQSKSLINTTKKSIPIE
jgi:hypothetical protein